MDFEISYPNDGGFTWVWIFAYAKGYYTYLMVIAMGFKFAHLCFSHISISMRDCERGKK